ncbi:hypothetical protein BRAO375_4670015 [Bradyrhizobium sp. ORS 375]|uniref:hypothetical protein n=1 Tax=Bradyrhizobium sp. (strain ORS 375) TaxID=566679 RepID=UPI0002407AEA|nr:hypothetical protein [Bradyrhizobium sp. ORS 375]CCD95740.1 hypothetical protein BRAO375_4670015 [Bradyrhizobium sp. ORS 375]
MSKAFQITVAATRWVRAYEFTPTHALYAGQALFTLGWSLIWAVALQLVTFMPMGVGLLLMGAGLACPNAQRWRQLSRQLPANSSSRNEPAIEEAPAA